LKTEFATLHVTKA